MTFAAGLAISAIAPSGAALIVGIGVLVGIGISCTSFGVVMAAVGRSASVENRSMAMGLASAGGSLGQVLLVPLAQFVTETSGVSASLLVLALLMLVTAPFGILLDRKNPPPSRTRTSPRSPSVRVLAQAIRHPGYGLLTIGFFACGFQLAFIATHLPGYLILCHMPLGLGATALALIGLFNIAGSWCCGWLGGKFRQQYVLGWLYLVRSIAVGVFFLLPKTETTVIIFASVMGLAWLGAVPLTSGFVARVSRHTPSWSCSAFASSVIRSARSSERGSAVLFLTLPALIP
ncbi:MAG: MFS transporter [Bradyrhizobium sp.]